MVNFPTNSYFKRCPALCLLEYFQSMLGSPWMEASWKDGSIKMPMPEKILKIVLDFLYIDEAPNLKGDVMQKIMSMQMNSTFE